MEKISKHEVDLFITLVRHKNVFPSEGPGSQAGVQVTMYGSNVNNYSTYSINLDHQLPQKC